MFYELGSVVKLLCHSGFRRNDRMGLTGKICFGQNAIALGPAAGLSRLNRITTPFAKEISPASRRDRHSGESRNPGCPGAGQLSGNRGLWIPASARMTVAKLSICDSLGDWRFLSLTITGLCNRIGLLLGHFCGIQHQIQPLPHAPISAGARHSLKARYSA